MFEKSTAPIITAWNRYHMPIDPQYIDAVKRFEGFRSTPYWDYKQFTSGYGTRASGPDEIIDKAAAEQRLSEALTNAAKHVDSVNPNLPAGARAALIDLTFNAGPGWANAGLGELVRAGDLQGAAQRFLEYNKAGGQVLQGLVKRRQEGAGWFSNALMPVAQATPTAAPTPASQRPSQAMPPPMAAAAAQAGGVLGNVAPQSFGGGGVLGSSPMPAGLLTNAALDELNADQDGLQFMPMRKRVAQLRKR